MEEAGELDSTLIVFSGDHGLALGEHGLMGKQNPYDPSIRVPLVFSGPGIPVGAVRSDLVYSGSILPTICDLVGIPVPDHVEFASLHAAIDGRDPQPLSEIYGAYRDLQRLLRTESEKLVVYPVSGRIQLFDVIADPWEIDDLSAAPGMTERVDSLLSRLRGRQAALDDTGPIVGR